MHAPAISWYDKENTKSTQTQCILKMAVLCLFRIYILELLIKGVSDTYEESSYIVFDSRDSVRRVLLLSADGLY